MASAPTAFAPNRFRALARHFLLRKTFLSNRWRNVRDKKFEFDFLGTLRENPRQAVESFISTLSSTPNRGFLRHDAVPVS